MTMRAEARLDRELRQVLEQSGRKWEAVYGSKHVKVYVDGRLFTVTSKGTANQPRPNYNRLLTRFMEEMQG